VTQPVTVVTVVSLVTVTCDWRRCLSEVRFEVFWGLQSAFFCHFRGFGRSSSEVLAARRILRLPLPSANRGSCAKHSLVREQNENLSA
jgi:hypothetical protein